MTINFNVTGAKRKELVNLISNFTGSEIKYKGVPTFAYEVDYFIIDKNGVLSFDDSADSEEIEGLLEMLAEKNFIAVGSENNAEPNNETVGLTVELPLDKVKVGNLTKLLDAKGNLIKKALGIKELPIRVSDEQISFPWFSEIDSDTAIAYTQFISALCKMSREQKRITVTEKAVDNEKYAFRCFLLRLGFIGNEYKTTRKILLRNLEGSSAYKSGEKSSDVSEVLADERLNLKVNGIYDGNEIAEALADAELIHEVNAIHEEETANV